MRELRKKLSLSRLFWVLLIFVHTSCTSSTTNCNGCVLARKLNPRVVFTGKKGKKITVQVELACTVEEQRKGLMHRKSMDDNKGMLFIFSKTDFHSFWMKNTFIPLDMIHFDRDKQIVGIVEDARPHDETGRSIKEKSLYVLEVNAFFSRLHGIKKGQKAQFIDIPKCSN